ncbi:TPA: phage antirepressor Ant [Escherichia coli]|nr:phage antirepressor Ant [Escherichia coli]HBB8662722.1 phage antirepressor Ant [Escherichia coli]
MKSIATAVSTINVPFHGAELYVVNHNGEPYTPMKPIVEGMGMTWQSQHRKLMERFKTCIIEMMIQLPGDTQRRLVICLALRKLAGWLQTISPNKVRPEIRDNVIHYQEECDDVLYEYWTKGHVVNPRKAKKALPGKITTEQQEAIKQLVMSRGQSLPKEKQAKAMITMWSSLKSHFGCSYKEIREEQFTEALSLAARIPLEGEFIGKSKHNEMSCFGWRMNVHNLNSACIHLDAMYRIWRDEMEPALRLLGSPVATRFCGRIADCYSVTASVKKSLEDAAGLKGLQPF